MAGDEGSGGGEIVDFVLYMFVLGPAVEWCLKSKKVNPHRPASVQGIALAVLLLAAIAGVKLSWEYVGRDNNHYETLGVRVDSPSSEIKRAYKTISLKYHPDKNPDDPNAATKFIKYQSAYEVLKDSNKRDTYNKFGQAGLDDKSGSQDTSSQLWSLAMFYIIWLIVGYLLTMGKASEDGRTWAFSGLLTLAVFEYQTKILSIDYLAPLFPQSTTHEKVEILHKLFPPFLHGARMISQVIFTDVALVNRLRVEEMHVKCDDLFRQVIHMNGGSSFAGLSAKAKGVGSAEIAQMAEETGQRLAKAGQLSNATAPQHPANSAAAAAGAVAGGAVQPAAGSAAGAAAGGSALSPEEQATARAMVADAHAEVERNKSRMTNVAVFFVGYAVFKYVADHELL